ncbi:UNVERIFIED_CONTAM: hypothetical protein Sradi_1882000 [Sesamum radiatum]|uniref:Reverse transcriptase zinc-binding domain-containing protein n=1 Tax=Sesamum radiatum TaxID=300843 RepID=A0AAW2TWU7_SESRA
MTADFWWNNMGEHRTHWIAWKRLCDPMKEGASLGSRPSLTWRGILAARELLMEGCRWKEEVGTWHFATKGVFTVTEAYVMEMARILRSRPSSSSTRSKASVWEQQRWTQIWKSKVPPKIRIFIWRVTHDAVPTMSNLERRWDVQDQLCGICHEEIECISHVLRSVGSLQPSIGHYLRRRT